MRTGVANIPLDYGTCPRWLFDKMVRMGRLIAEAIVYEFGPDEFISRLADPFFFQSLGSVLGFDWNSSGLTTIVCGAMKFALHGTEKDLGIFIAGGKGKTSKKTPQQIEDFGFDFSFDFAPKLIYASRMSAKVDSAALQDGFQLYHHSFFFTSVGKWAVVQQGMNTDVQKARRYHWSSDIEKQSEDDFDFVNEPHSAVCSDTTVQPLNLVANESSQTRDYSTGLIKENFNSLLSDLKSISARQNQAEFVRKTGQQILPILDLPSDKDSPAPYLPFDYKRVEKILYDVKEKDVKDFEGLLGQTKAGPATLRALALVSEIIYGAKPSFRDPVRYSFAHGGKDGYPYPVDSEGYEKSISILERAVKKARMGEVEKMDAFKKLALR
jgi:hypothetical protein